MAPRIHPMGAIRSDMTENKIIMKNAIEILRGKWGKVIVAGLVGTAISIWFPLIGQSQTYLAILSIVLGGPVAIGICLFILKIVRGEGPDLNHLGSFFLDFEKFIAALVVSLLAGIFIFLWTLLLIVPGILAALDYTMIYYIVADEPTIGSMEAIKKSKRMMYGHRWRMFCLWCRFIGWFFLGLITGGILFIWISPYFTTTVALLYEELRIKASDT